MATLFQLPKVVPVVAGESLPGAKAYFYQAGTTTPITTYTTAALSVAHNHPVVADSNGVFAPIFISENVNSTYRFQLYNSADVLQYDIDNIGTQAEFKDGSLSDLGIRFMAQTTTGFYRSGSGVIEVVCSGTQVAQFNAFGLYVPGVIQLGNSADTTLARIAAGRASIENLEIGYRKLLRSSTTSGTLTAAEVGYCVPATGAITIDNNVFAAGDEVHVYNDSGSNITLTQGTGVTMRLAGTATTGNRTLAQRGMSRLWFNSASEVIVDGTGVT